MRRGRACGLGGCGPLVLSRLSELPPLAAGAEAVSFDVFDTLIHRRLAHEAILRKTAASRG
ncbi:MAG: hypothetical protein ACE37J_12560 [Pikeienuella sp.]|uniref:hypothetical protein n=1 Tax=Pikeienuella sp. TaxID=2831957 RepID=UPI00391B9B90